MGDCIRLQSCPRSWGSPIFKPLQQELQILLTYLHSLYISTPFTFCKGPLEVGNRYSGTCVVCTLRLLASPDLLSPVLWSECCSLLS